MALVVVFTGFNLGNTANLSLVFVTLKDVPVALLALTGFLLGLMTALVLVLGRKKPAQKTAVEDAKPKLPATDQADPTQVAEAEQAPAAGKKTRRIRGGGRQVQ